MTTGLFHANGQLVCMAWIQALVTGVPVADKLPQNVPGTPEPWADTGFLTVRYAGGTPNPGDIPERRTVSTVHSWAARRATSKKIPRRQAITVLEEVVNATYRTVPTVVLPPQYQPVWIEYAKCVLDVMEAPEPDSNFAHFTADIEIGWIERQPVGRT